ncbi:MAG: DUF2079 domain-containing protein [Thermoplasmata archaeon]|nr:DUF2079 domain-containing protein [Candidatus Sysuiplasma acidicola]MBX8645523.1 DUF2079 domain-containing protein [Candidatus Sysuiplasma acidicola]
MRRFLSFLRRNDFLPLVLLTVSYTAVISYLSLLRYYNFFTSNWDFGIMQQMLWSTLHGHLLFETADYSTGGFLSYLEINSSYVALPVAFIYALYQSPVTLFTVQSLAVALASFPLYFIALRSGHGRRAAFAFVLLFLFGMGTLSSVFYDFHWESMIPAEFFSFYLLYSSGRYRYAAAILALGSATLEIFPFLAAAVVLYCAMAPHPAPATRIPFFRKRPVHFLLACAASFIFIIVLQKTVINATLGMAPGGSGTTASSYFVHPVLLPQIFFASSVYWLLLLASVAFLPLLSGRSLIMSLPWFIESVFLYPKFSIMFGYQYAFIALPPLIVSSVLGAERLKQDTRRSTLLLPFIIVFASLSLLPGMSAVFLRQNGYVLSLPVLLACVILFIAYFRKEINQEITPKHRSRQGPSMFAHGRHLLVPLLLSILFFNLVMGPLNTSNFGVNSGYNLSYSSNPSFHDIARIASMVKEGSTVLASDNLFPLVDSNLHAYSALWIPFSRSLMPYLPFNATTLPEYVFADSSQLPSMPTFIVRSIFNSSVYGLVAYVYSSGYPGTVYLFRRGYAGHAYTFMASTFNSSFRLDYHDLRIGLSGFVEKYPGSMSGSVIGSRNGYAIRPSDVNSRNIWYGPYMTLLPGSYNITFNMMIESGNGNVSLPVLYMNGNSFGFSDYYSANLSSSSIPEGGFGNVTFHFNCTEPASLTEFRGYLLLRGGVPAGSILLNYIFVQRNSA